MVVGGGGTLKERTPFNTLTREMTPEETKSLFIEKKWETVVAFHTRNPPHRAHECLQRMDQCQVFNFSYIFVKVFLNIAVFII